MRTDRDTRIDVFRALALLTIFINHVPGNVYELLTLKNFGFADAAEVFVLISGVAIGIAYGSKFEGPGWLAATISLWRRSWALVRTHFVTTIATLAIFAGAAVFAGRPWLMKVNNIGPLLEDPARVLIGIGTLGHQLGYNNILPMYAVLLLATPAILWGVSRSVGLTLFVSGALWLGAGLFQLAPPNYPLPGFWFLNPLSWQFLFVIAIAATVHVRRGGRLPRAPVLTQVAAAYLLGALVWINTPLWGQPTWFGLPPVLGGFDKTFLSLARLLDVLALAWLVVRWPALSNLARTAPDNPLAILGRHSLAVFATGTVLAMAAQALRSIYAPSLAFDTVLIAGGILAQFALAYGLEWRDAALRKPATIAPRRARSGVPYPEPSRG